MQKYAASWFHQFWVLVLSRGTLEKILHPYHWTFSPPGVRIRDLNTAEANKKTTRLRCTDAPSPGEKMWVFEPQLENYQIFLTSTTMLTSVIISLVYYRNSGAAKCSNPRTAKCSGNIQFEITTCSHPRLDKCFAHSL